MTLPAEALDVSVLVPAKDEAPNLTEIVRQSNEATKEAVAARLVSRIAEALRTSGSRDRPAAESPAS